MRLVVTATAARQIREADEWWEEHRPSAQGLLRAELTRAFALISEQPHVGAIASNVEIPGVRRVVLHRTRYHLYYRPEPEVVEVLGLWHTSREERPNV